MDEEKNKYIYIYVWIHMKPSEFYTVVGLRSLFLSSARCWLNAKCCAVRSVRNVFFHFFVVVSYVCVECDAQRCRICVTRVHVSMRIWRSRLFCPKRAREATGRLCVKCFFFAISWRCYFDAFSFVSFPQPNDLFWFGLLLHLPLLHNWAFAAAAYYIYAHVKCPAVGKLPLLRYRELAREPLAHCFMQYLSIYFPFGKRRFNKFSSNKEDKRCNFFAKIMPCVFARQQGNWP